MAEKSWFTSPGYVRGLKRRPPQAAGRPLGPDGDPEGPWGRPGVPRWSKHQLCTNTGQSSDPSDDYKPQAALEGTHFFLGENQHAPKMIYFLALL